MREFSWHSQSVLFDASRSDSEMHRRRETPITVLHCYEHIVFLDIGF